MRSVKWRRYAAPLALSLWAFPGSTIHAQTQPIQLDPATCESGAFPVWITGQSGYDGHFYCSSAQAASALPNINHVSTNAALAATSTGKYPRGVWRNDYSAGLGAPPLFYAASPLPCTSNNGGGDNGSQVPSADGKCWLAQFDSSGADVREWGVDLTGVADSTTTLQNAFNYGGNLSAPAGTITVSTGGSPVICLTNGTVLQGSGFNTVIQNASATSDTFKATATGCRFTGMRFTASPGVTKTGGAFVDCYGANLCQIDNFSMYSWFWGIELSGGGSSGARFYNGQINVPSGVNSNGIIVNPISGNSIDVVARDLFITGGGSLSGNCGVLVQGVGDMTIDHISTEQISNGLCVSPSGGQVTQALFVNDSLFDQGIYGINVSPSSTGVVELLSVHHSWEATNSVDGVLVQAAAGAKVQEVDLDDDIASGNGAHGLLNGSVTNTNIRVRGGCYAQNTLNGITEAGSTTLFQVSDATTGLCGQFTANGGYGISLAGSNTNFNIHDVNALGNGTGSLQLTSYSGSTGVIHDVQGYNPIGVTGPTNVPASPATICAGPSPETLYFLQSATNTATVKLTNTSGPLIGTMSSATIPVVTNLGANECAFVTWATTNPTYTASVH